MKKQKKSYIIPLGADVTLFLYREKTIVQTALRILFAWGATALLLPPFIALAWRIGALDVPTDSRRMHRDSVPRVGGVVIFFVFLAATMLAGLTRELRFALLGASVVFAVGLADDLFNLPAWLKFFFQTVAAALAVGGSETVRGWWAFPAIFWVVLQTNAHNMIDGLDGLFAGTAILEGIGLGAVLALGGQSAMPPLLLAAICAAFRMKNRTPAKLFAGDCGSGTVGFLLAMFSLPAFSGEWAIGSVSPLLVMAYPTADLVAAVLRRFFGGQPIFRADREHFHHRLVASGFSKVAAGRILLTVCALFCVVGVLAAREAWAIVAATGCVGAAIFLLLGGLFLRRREETEKLSKKVDFRR